ncbi:MAG TPA: Ku protein [Nitrospiraceae bacterium]|nr:Ku protein [Nitrospiraceae bacterium]
MPRALQSASLAFGLVNIPVKLYTAAASQSVSFHLLHRKDQSRIHEQMVCIAEDTPVSRDELVKGYEVKKGTYVEVTEEELDALEAQVNRSVEIQEFIPIEAVDPVSFKKTYYLGPDKGGEKPYRLLAQAMQRERKSAIAQFVQRGKEELVMVRPVRENQLMLHVLYYADEVRAFEGAPSGKAASTAELNLAVQLIHQLASKTWDSAKYHDTYRERVLAFIKKKQAGEKMAPPKPARAPGKVLDLMGTLKQSLAHAHQPRTRKNPRTKRKKVKGTRKAA